MQITKAQIVPYSSIVGGGLMLLSDDGQALFGVMFRGTTQGITKEQTAALSEQFARFVETDGLTVPERAALAKEQGG